jgi:hypothetical protein
VLFLYFVGFGRKALKIYQVPSLEQSLKEVKFGRLILRILDWFAAEKRKRQNLLILERFQNEHVFVF